MTMAMQIGGGADGDETMTTVVELIIHLDDVDGEVVWWAESPGVEGFSAAAPTLAGLRETALAALVETLGGPVELVEKLVGEHEAVH